MVPVDEAVKEWRLYRVTVDESCADPEKHWETVLSYQTSNGQSRFPNMVDVIRCVMSISHGNAETERSFFRYCKYSAEASKFVKYGSGQWSHNHKKPHQACSQHGDR